MSLPSCLPGTEFRNPLDSAQGVLQNIVFVLVFFPLSSPPSLLLSQKVTSPRKTKTKNEMLRTAVYLEHGDVVCVEHEMNFDNNNNRGDLIGYFEDGKLVRIEYEDGSTDYVNGGQVVRMEFCETHVRHGETLYYENKKLVRVEKNGRNWSRAR